VIREGVKKLVRKVGIESEVAGVYAWIHRSRTSGVYSLECGDYGLRMENRSPWMEQRLRHQEEMECSRVLEVISSVEEGDVVYDIGANYGLYTGLIGQALGNVTLISIEPHPENFEILRANLSRNGIDAECLNYAIAAESGQLSFSTDTEQLVTDETGSDHETIAVDVITGDTLRDEHDLPVPTHVKIDVEGAELEVIEGFQETLAREECKWIYCEVHPEKGEQWSVGTDTVGSTLEELGFSVEYLNTPPQREPLLIGRK